MLNDYGKDLFKPWLSVPNILLLLAVLFVIALFKLTSSELASWVQAIGSIAAIWGAFVISNSQVARQMKYKEDEDLRKARAYYAVVKSAADHVRSLGEMIIQRPPPEVFKDAWDMVLSQRLEMSLNSLIRLPAHELGSYDLVIFHNAITGAMSKALEKIKVAVTTNAFHEHEVLFMYEDVYAQCNLIEVSWTGFDEAASK